MKQEKIPDRTHLLRNIRKIGWINIFIALFILSPLLLILEFKVFEPYQTYNYEEISRKGKLQSAKITALRDKRNTTFNGRIPKIIEYVYTDAGNTQQDTFETIELEKVYALGLDSIQVAVWNNQSVIVGLEQANFPIRRFWLGPVLFVVIGGLIVLITSIILNRSPGAGRNG